MMYFALFSAGLPRMRIVTRNIKIRLAKNQVESAELIRANFVLPNRKPVKPAIGKNSINHPTIWLSLLFSRCLSFFFSFFFLFFLSRNIKPRDEMFVSEKWDAQIEERSRLVEQLGASDLRTEQLAGREERNAGIDASLTWNVLRAFAGRRCSFRWSRGCRVCGGRCRCSSFGWHGRCTFRWNGSSGNSSFSWSSSFDRGRPFCWRSRGAAFRWCSWRCTYRHFFFSHIRGC